MFGQILYTQWKWTRMVVGLMSALDMKGAPAMMPVRSEERSNSRNCGCSNSAMNMVGTPYSDVQRSSATPPAGVHPNNNNCGFCHLGYGSGAVSRSTHVDGLVTRLRRSPGEDLTSALIGLESAGGDSLDRDELREPLVLENRQLFVNAALCHNLTAIERPEQIVSHHLLDSLALVRPFASRRVAST